MPVQRRPPPDFKSGWILKRGHLRKNWKMRYFVLQEGRLTCFVTPSPHPPYYGESLKGFICLQDCELVRLSMSIRSLTIRKVKNASNARARKDPDRDENEDEDEIMVVTVSDGQHSSEKAEWRSLVLNFEQGSRIEEAEKELRAWSQAIQAHIDFYAMD
jgi:hypothetical protein